MELQSVKYENGQAKAVMLDKEGYRIVVVSPPNPDKQKALKEIREKIKLFQHGS